MLSARSAKESLVFGLLFYHHSVLYLEASVKDNSVTTNYTSIKKVLGQLRHLHCLQYQVQRMPEIPICSFAEVTECNSLELQKEYPGKNDL